MKALRHALAEEPVYTGPEAVRAFEAAKRLLMAYRFYAPRVVTTLPAAELRAGDELLLRARVGPIRFRGPVKVVRVWDKAGVTFRSAGFTYEALPGHPERGVASFAVVHRGNEVFLRIATDSAPARWFSRIAAPLARRAQRSIERHGFARMRALLRAEMQAGGSEARATGPALTRVAQGPAGRGPTP